MRTNRPFSASLGLCGAFLASVLAAAAAPGLPPELQGVGVEEHLNQPIDLNLTFTAENGYPVALKSFFHQGKPVIIDLVYYSCPMLCTLILNGQTKAMRALPWAPGDHFEVLTISIDPRDTFDLAQKKRAMYEASLGRAAPGWHFLTDQKGNVKKLADELGFHYRYVAAQKQYAHPGVVMILTPDGKISRYLYGIKFNPRDLRLALTEAAADKFGISDRILLFCFHYDPHAHAYTLFASNLMRAGGVVTMLLLGLVLWRLHRREKRRQHEVVAQ